MHSQLPLRRLRPAFRGFGLGIVLAALAVAVVVQTTPLGTAIDRFLDPLRLELLRHPATGRVMLVEMDAASTAAIKRWPWPRDNYARAIDNLRRAGAASIVFDVDLGSQDTPDGDRALAAALARADGLVALPTFGQQAGSADHRTLDAMPLPLFRPHVSLASVSIAPDDDGLIRHMPLGTMTYGVPHPSLSAFIAHQSGEAEQAYPIDFSIQPDTIPRLSFVAVRDGRFDPAIVRGRDVLIGATAIEMGDRYATPRWRNLPGVVIQALAADTLLRGMPRETSGVLAIVIAMLLALPIVAVRRGWLIAATFCGALAVLLGTALVMQRAGLYMPVAGALALLVVVILGDSARATAIRFQRQRMSDEESGLPNRRAFVAEGAGEAIIVIVVSNYDSLAAVLPEGGDAQLIARLADRVRLSLKGATVYRIDNASMAVRAGGDRATDIAKALRLALLPPVEVGGRRLDAATSFGIALDAVDPDKGLQTAALAAEQAWRAGLPWKLANADLTEVEQGVSLLGQLDEALADGSVAVHYQPKLDTATGIVTGGEALVRWRLANGQYVSPAVFIPLVEEANRIEPLTLFVLATVLADIAQWRAAGHDLKIGVNISAKLLGKPDFEAAVDDLLASSAVPTSSLIFEITESAAFEDAAAALASLVRFSERGIALSMDDYGTGQSTLSYLSRLPLSELKIDRSFVSNATHDRREAAMVRSTVDLAHELGLKVVAEGVEDAPCLEFLRSIGCDIAQGYLIGKPQPENQFIETVLSFANLKEKAKRLSA